MKDLIKTTAGKHGVGDVTVTAHRQMFGTTLYRVRTTDGRGNRHGFDYVPNPQQPRSIHEQKLDQLMLGLKDMATFDDDHDTSKPSLAV